MSENTTTPAVFQVKITGKEDFRAVAPVFGIKTPEGPGAMPKRQLLVAVREAVKAGTAELIETDYFGVDAVLNGVGSTTSTKGGWKISYRVINPETRKVDGPVLSVEVDRDKIKSILPDATLQGAKLNAVIALVMVANFEGASVAEFKNYVVTDVVRVDSVSVPAVADDAPKGDDTGETNTDADKASETVTPDVPVEVKADTPELVPAESAGKTTAKRGRKTPTTAKK